MKIIKGKYKRKSLRESFVTTIPQKEKELLDKLDDLCGEDVKYYDWSTFILPNGHFLTPSGLEENGYEDLSYEHEDFTDAMSDIAGEFRDDILYNYCVKVNTTYPYIALPEKLRITPEQLQRIKNLLDYGDLYSQGDLTYDNDLPLSYNVVAIYTPTSRIGYNLDYTSSNDIIKKINKYYISGVLEESHKLNEAGYDGWSMSNNARDAYDNDIMPKSSWTKDKLINKVKEIVKDDGIEIKFNIDKLNNIPLNLLKDLLLTYDSWHHTSNHYNKTDFYKIDTNYLEELTDDIIDQKIGIYKDKSKEDRERKKNNTRKKAKVNYYVWGGTRKHPKPTEYSEICDIDDTWAYTSQGKKKLSGNYIWWTEIKDN